MKKINQFDLTVAVILILIISVFVVGITNKEQSLPQKVQIKIKITQNARDIYPTAQKLGDIYFDTVNTPVAIQSTSMKTENGVDSIEVSIVGNGKKEQNRDIFEGLRVMVGQKAELHGSFWAQGVITDIKYED